MSVTIKISDTKINDEASVMNNLTINASSNNSIELKQVEINDKAELLNNISELQADEILKQLEIQADLLRKSGRENQDLKNLLLAVKKPESSIKKILIEHLPNLLTGTLANIVSGIIMGQKLS